MIGFHTPQIWVLSPLLYFYSPLLDRMGRRGILGSRGILGHEDRWIGELFQ